MSFLTLFVDFISLIVFEILCSVHFYSVHFYSVSERALNEIKLQYITKMNSNVYK